MKSGTRGGQMTGGWVGGSKDGGQVDHVNHYTKQGMKVLLFGGHPLWEMHIATPCSSNPSSRPLSQNIFTTTQRDKNLRRTDFISRT